MLNCRPTGAIRWGTADDCPSFLLFLLPARQPRCKAATSAGSMAAWHNMFADKHANIHVACASRMRVLQASTAMRCRRPTVKCRDMARSETQACA